MIPQITHLQFLILSILREGEFSGRKLRAELTEHGIQKSGPAFYQLMARLEDNRLVKGWYTQKIVEGQIIKERCYKLTKEGQHTWNGVSKFYMELMNFQPKGLW